MLSCVLKFFVVKGELLVNIKREVVLNRAMLGWHKSH